MTQIIVVTPGQSQIVASGPQFGVKYTLIGADGARAVFNDPEDMDYVGWLTGLSGLDSPEVRESADDLIGDDGGVHGDFFYGRRPIILEGNIDGRPTNVERNQRMTRLQRASNATRRDSVLRWIVEGGVDQIVKVRRNQPLRISGGVLKEFQLAMVSADPRIYAAQIQEQRFLPGVTTGTITNYGTMRTPPLMTVYGPATDIEVRNFTTGEAIIMAPSFTLTGSQSVTFDVANRTAIRSDGVNVFSSVQFASTTWWEIQPGVNNPRLTATGTTGATSLLIQWQDAWI
jgi:hypothetical protein